MRADCSRFKHKQVFTGRKDILCCQALSAFRGFFFLGKKKSKYSSFQQEKQTDIILELLNGFTLNTSLIVLRSSIDQAGLISLLMDGFISRRPSPTEDSTYSKNASLNIQLNTVLNYDILTLAYVIR